MTPAAVINQLKRAFKTHLALDTMTASALLGSARLYDKAYELSCMLETLQLMRSHRSGLRFVLMRGTSVMFRAKGGPIQPTLWPYVAVSDRGRPFAEVWVDIEFQSISASRQNKALTGKLFGKVHELDVVVVRPGTSDYPDPDDILLGVEAKHRPFQKALLKELLGVRREMTMKSGLNSNSLAWWSRSGLPAKPASGLVAFCSDANILKYNDPADYWGIAMIHHPL